MFEWELCVAAVCTQTEPERRNRVVCMCTCSCQWRLSATTLLVLCKYWKSSACRKNVAVFIIVIGLHGSALHYRLTWVIPDKVPLNCVCVRVCVCVAHRGSPGKMAVKWVCVCVYVCVCII